MSQHQRTVCARTRAHARNACHGRSCVRACASTSSPVHNPRCRTHAAPRCVCPGRPAEGRHGQLPPIPPLAPPALSSAPPASPRRPRTSAAPRPAAPRRTQQHSTMRPRPLQLRPLRHLTQPPQPQTLLLALVLLRLLVPVLLPQPLLWAVRRRLGSKCEGRLCRAQPHRAPRAAQPRLDRSDPTRQGRRRPARRPPHAPPCLRRQAGTRPARRALLSPLALPPLTPSSSSKLALLLEAWRPCHPLRQNPATAPTVRAASSSRGRPPMETLGSVSSRASRYTATSGRCAWRENGRLTARTGSPAEQHVGATEGSTRGLHRTSALACQRRP